MDEVVSEALNFVLDNNIWFIVILVLIFLAIIGYYADKTNFGQGSKIEKDEESTANDKKTQENKNEVKVKPKKEDIKIEKTTKEQPSKSADEILEEEYENFEKAFDNVLPERQLFASDLITDIDNMSLDKTQRINISDIPDLDDIDLPKIKKMDNVDEDIWK